ncbi:MAG: EF2563 family selenium-dependent molybdenum hydroxylase system protein [Clostridia bacterium]|nr:EF2563 family selenium-dependent molybdenum hydroxylase system protein [Clostridia bacterium]
MDTNAIIIVRGGGDMATAVIHRLWRAGFKVLVLETDRPSAIRRQVAVSEAVYDGKATVEDMTAVRIDAPSQCELVWANDQVPLLVDPRAEAIRHIQPDVVVDAMIAKKNLGTHMDMAPMTIALGPGFVAGSDVHAVIETMRGHNLGRIIWAGAAQPNTGIPGKIGGYAAERVIHAPHAGVIRHLRTIGDYVNQGEGIAVIAGEDGEHTVPASISGLIRGLIREGFDVPKGFKIADIDPRQEEYANCFTISDKARCIAGSVLEVVCMHLLRGQK